MSDVMIFAMGCVVSVMVATAVGLLLWAAGNEPSPGELPESSAPSGARRTKSRSVQRTETRVPGYTPALDTRSST